VVVLLLPLLLLVDLEEGLVVVVVMEGVERGALLVLSG
jgi:hypothetical protein